MALNITVGGATAVSYISVASADEYMNTVENSDAWDAIAAASTGTLSATTRKENLLKQATRMNDNLRYFGSRDGNTLIGATDYQNLEFPRADNYDASGNLFIPDQIKWGEAEQALYILNRSVQKTTEEGTAIEGNFYGNDALMYLNKYRMRQVIPTGTYPWQSGRP